MFKTAPLFLALLTTAFTAEISSSYAMIEKQAAFKPELKTEPVEPHVIKEVQKEVPVAEHPVYTANVRNQGRARIEPVRSFGPVINHSAMLSDQPPVSADVNRNVSSRNIDGKPCHHDFPSLEKFRKSALLT